MNKLLSAAIALVLSAPIAASTSNANACGYYPGPCAPMVAPAFAPVLPSRMPVPGTPVFGPSAGMPRQVNNGVMLPPGMGGYLGSGSAIGLQAMGVPAPVAGWAGGRIAENYGSASREENYGDALLRTAIGISNRDIRENGILGGRNSEARKIVCVGGLLC